MRNWDRGNSSSARRRRTVAVAQAVALGMRRTARPAITLALLLPSAIAWADGQIRFKVFDSKTKEPLPGAIIKMEPAPTEIDELQFSTATDGTITTGELASGERPFQVSAIVNGNLYKAFKGRVTVVDSQVVDVEVPLVLQGPIELIVKAKVLRLNIDDTSQSTFRDRKFFELFPVGIGNRQSLTKPLRSVPGMAYDSVNRVHARGEEGGLAYYLDGFQVPAFLTGAASQFLLPEATATLSARTGGYSAEHTGGAGAVLDIQLRPALSTDSKKPFSPELSYRVGAGEFGTNEAYLTIARQRGEVPDRRGDIGFIFTLSKRTTANFLEAPQRDRQSGINNGGHSETIFSKMEMRLTPTTEISSFFNIGSGKAGIANRTGLPASFRPNQGYGFGGADVQENYAQGDIFLDQQNSGNRVTQKDENRIFVTQLKQKVSPTVTSVVSMGYTESRQIIGNTSAFTSLRNLPANSPIEYKPTVLQDYQGTQTQLDFTIKPPQSKHTMKAGAIVQETQGGESMQFVPQSQLALQRLLNFSTFVGPRLNPTFPTPTTDRVPVLIMSRKSNYMSLYGQDTWVPREDVRVNAGFRFESYKQTQVYRLGMPKQVAFSGSSATSSAFSMRINSVYQIPPTLKLGLPLPGKGKRRGFGLKTGASQPTLLRASFNQIFTPALGQGNVGFGQSDTTIALATPNKAQLTDQIDLSIERQLPKRASVKLGFYNKKSRNAIGFQQMILGPQALAYSTVNLGKTKASGMELTYEFNARDFEEREKPGELSDYKGVAGFLSLAQGSSKRQVNGVFVNNEFDQKTTITAGVGYTMPKGDQVGFSYYYGSGLASSIFNGGGRQAISEVNLRFAAAPGRFGKEGVGAELGIENLFNARNLMNFNGSYAGTRFQQGRRWVLSVTGKY